MRLANCVTLYIGGGTPTALSAQQLAYLLTELPKFMDLSEVEEFTIEANPGDLDPDKIAGPQGLSGQSGLSGCPNL